MSVVIRLKVPIEMHYTVIPMGTSKVNSSRAFLSIFGAFLCHPVADGRTTMELKLCPFLTVLTLPFQKNTSCNVPKWGATGSITSWSSTSTQFHGHAFQTNEKFGALSKVYKLCIVPIGNSSTPYASPLEILFIVLYKSTVCKIWHQIQKKQQLTQ